MKVKITAYVTEFKKDIIPQFRMNDGEYYATEGVKVHFSVSDYFKEDDKDALNKIGKRAFEETKKRGLKVRQKDFFD